jgi:protoheme ferro-lyase
VVEAATGDDTGVVLVGHGQPDSRAKRHPAYDERELSFLSRIRMTLLERGFDAESVRVAWADWNTPDVTSSVRHLAALGRNKVLVVPAVYPLDTLATRLDLEIALRQARVHERVSVVSLPSWRDDEAVIAELRTRVTDAVARLA